MRVYLGKPRMDVCVEDTLWKKRRVIRYRWMKQDRGDGSKFVPPKKWWAAVCGEVEYQRQRDFKKKTKGFL